MSTCLQCSTSFVSSNPHREAKYCSRECYYASRVGHAPTNPRRRQINHCEFCGTEFEAGGRSGKKRATKYCSLTCRDRAGTRHPEPKTLDPLDAAYLAGFFDGEGSIIQPKATTWRVTIYQSDEPVIRWIAEKTGTGHVGSHMPPATNLVKKPKARRQWYWNLYGRNAALLLQQLVPYMIVKRDRAEDMLCGYDLI